MISIVGEDAVEGMLLQELGLNRIPSSASSYNENLMSRERR